MFQDEDGNDGIICEVSKSTNRLLYTKQEDIDALRKRLRSALLSELTKHYRHLDLLSALQFLYIAILKCLLVEQRQIIQMKENKKQTVAISTRRRTTTL